MTMYSMRLRHCDDVRVGEDIRQLYLERTFEFNFIPSIGMDICFYKDDYWLKVTDVEYDFYKQVFNVSVEPDSTGFSDVIHSARFWTENGWSITDYSGDLKPMLQTNGFISTKD